MVKLSEIFFCRTISYSSDCLSSGATAILTGSDGHLVDTGAQIEVQTVYEAGDMLVTTTEGDSSVSFGTIEPSLENTVAITM